MDPASIFAIVEGAGGLALKCVSLAKTLNDFASKYKQARLTVLSMVQHLEIVQLAWERINKWSQKYSQDVAGAICEEDEKLLKRLQTSLDVGYLVMEALEDDLLPFQRQLDNLGVRGKTKIVWSESALNAHQDRLGHQVQAMTCLLQTIQLELPENRRSFLKLSEPILFKSDESAYSIVPSRRSSKLSLFTTSTGSASLQYRPLAFEDALFTARVYKRNYRNHIINQLFKARTDRDERGATLENQRGFLSGSETTSNPLHPLVMSHPSTSVDFLFMRACQRSAPGTVQDLLISGRMIFDQRVSFDVIRWGLADAVLNDRVIIAQAILRMSSPKELNYLMEEDGLFLTKAACAKPDNGFLELLLEAAAQYKDRVARLDLNGQLLKVASMNSCRMMAMLIDAGADVSCADGNGFQPLHLVSVRPKGQEYMQKLLDCGANIDAQNDDGMTPLTYTCSRLMLSNAQYLVARGANLNISDRMGEQAIDKLQNPQVSFSLVFNLKRRLEALRVADIDALDRSIHIPLQEAALRGDMRPAGAALWFMGRDFLLSLDSFAKDTFQEMYFPSEEMKKTDRELMRDLIWDADVLIFNLPFSFLNINRSSSGRMFGSGVDVAGNYCAKRAKPFLHSITNFILWVIYKLTKSPYQPSQSNMLRSACQPVREFLSETIPNLVCTDLEEFTDMLREAANTLPDDWTYDGTYEQPYGEILN